MQLPAVLRNALEVELEGVPLGDLSRASALLTEQYRAGKPSRLTTSVERLAYVAARMPATYAAVHGALLQAQGSQVALAPRTVLDLGAGPGTAAWAATAVYPSLESARLVERNGALSALGQRLGLPLKAEWLVGDVGVEQPEADLVLLSYALGENDWPRILEQAWKATGMALALIEPGTPKGFALVREARQWLIARGGTIAAPCPHAKACPMAKDDWCHFAARVERTSLHRRMKGATMGYEDEKFSYVVASKAQLAGAEGRIIRHPQQKAGYVQLELCTVGGLVKENVAKSAGGRHREARKAHWGDAWPAKEKGEPEGSPVG